MTTREAAKAYLLSHTVQWGDKVYAVFNPHDKPVEELPVIYGFNDGGSPDWWRGQLLSEDGTALGSHICSNEGYMPHDLGVLEGSRPDRHKTFQTHYPDGYRMEFISYSDVFNHEGLKRAIERNSLKSEEEPTNDTQ